jgi:hypothetical protein
MIGWLMNMEQLAEWKLTAETEILWGKLLKCLFVHYKADMKGTWDQIWADM